MSIPAVPPDTAAVGQVVRQLSLVKHNIPAERTVVEELVKVASPWTTKVEVKEAEVPVKAPVNVPPAKGK